MCSHGGKDPQEGGGTAGACYRRSEGIPGYANAPMMALGAEGDSGGYRRPYC